MLLIYFKGASCLISPNLLTKISNLNGYHRYDQASNASDTGALYMQKRADCNNEFKFITSDQWIRGQRRCMCYLGLWYGPDCLRVDGLRRGEWDNKAEEGREAWDALLQQWWWMHEGWRCRWGSAAFFHTAPLRNTRDQQQAVHQCLGFVLYVCVLIVFTLSKVEISLLWWAK